MLRPHSHQLYYVSCGTPAGKQGRRKGLLEEGAGKFTSLQTHGKLSVNPLLRVKVIQSRVSVCKDLSASSLFMTQKEGQADLPGWGGRPRTAQRDT